MMTPPLRISPPLALRLHDALRGLTVAEGVECWLERPWSSERRFAANTTRTGVFAWHELPGIPPVVPVGSTATTPWRLVVSDSARRFLKFERTLSLPRPAGLLSAPVGAFGAVEGSLPLYAGPDADPTPQHGCVRARLIVATSGEPARWARIEVRDGVTVIGASYADETGHVTVPFDWPEPKAPPGGSVPPLSEQRWMLRLAVAYGALERPDLDALVAQPTARLLWRLGGATLSNIEVSYGRPTVVRSMGVDWAPISHVFVAPVA